jgi:chromosome segregation ATPase
MNIETEISCKTVCAGKIEVPTDKEIAALNEMRAIKFKVKSIKENIRQLLDSKNEKSRKRVSELERDLERYKTQWTEWQQKHKEAVRERMIILGHEE